jgi:hypothetical protein
MTDPADRLEGLTRAVATLTEALIKHTNLVEARFDELRAHLNLVHNTMEELRAVVLAREKAEADAEYLSELRTPTTPCPNGGAAE